MTTKIYIKGELPKNPVIIEGFPSKGFVSTIATRYMIDEMGMENVGYVKSDRIQSIAVVHNSKPMYPIRIYRKDNLVLIFSEISVPYQFVREFADTFDEWFQEINPDKVVLLAGITGRETEKEHEIFGLTTHPEIKEKMDAMDVETIEEGMLAGISSDILLNCLENNIPVISFMAETKYSPDPLGAASLLRILSSFLEIDIDIEKLVSKGHEIEGEFEKLTSEFKRGKLDHRGMNEYSPMYQ
ncbi:MAG: hypothetical protein B6U72_01310 [Candidatus Altiarchaeales archaeon ex4484_2]|nr:MAG: hypothetical protein B6U72_01310 [Candidatus Altiarchaeales archaeon ex4484_2]